MATLGVLIGNRGFFPAHLCTEGRRKVLQVLESEGIRALILPEEATRNGAVESLEEAQKYAEFFKAHRDELDGVLVSLPNFGDERAIANTLRWAGIDVPVLIHAFPDQPDRMSINFRRDSFCGKISVCNNLYQYGIRYSLTTLHTVDPDSEAFRADLRRFAAVCRVVRSLRGLRIGQIGARPAAFNTVRYSEKLLERAGITVEPLDLSELLGWIRRMSDQDAAVQQKLEEIRAYTDTQGIPEESLLKLAKLGVAIDRFLQAKKLQAVAIQCWTALEEFYGVVPCTPMSMLSNRLIPSACEADIPGVLSMYLLQQASGKPAALLDWNNNYRDELDKGVVFHCSNLPAAFFESQRMDYQEIIAGTVGKENTYGTLVGRIAPGPFTFCGLTTDEFSGRIRTYVGEGRFTDDPLETFGGYGVFEVPGLQQLLRYVCSNGFPHHVAATLNHVADVLAEALGTYLGWEVYRHQA